MDSKGSMLLEAIIVVAMISVLTLTIYKFNASTNMTWMEIKEAQKNQMTLSNYIERNYYKDWDALRDEGDITVITEDTTYGTKKLTVSIDNLSFTIEKR